jgi:transposase
MGRITKAHRQIENRQDAPTDQRPYRSASRSASDLKDKAKLLVAAFAGLVPRIRESGSSVHSRSRLSKVGSLRLRKSLYFPAITALRFNPLLKAMGLRLSTAGKSKMLIIGATRRKAQAVALGLWCVEVWPAL